MIYDDGRVKKSLRGKGHLLQGVSIGLAHYIFERLAVYLGFTSCYVNHVGYWLGLK